MPRIWATGMRVPLMHAWPWQILGSTEIRSCMANAPSVNRTLDFSHAKSGRLLFFRLRAFGFFGVVRPDDALAFTVVELPGGPGWAFVTDLVVFFHQQGFELD